MNQFNLRTRTDHTPGFGIEIDADTKGGLLVRRILRGGAADLDGRLCPNDVLVAVNGIGVVRAGRIVCTSIKRIH